MRIRFYQYHRFVFICLCILLVTTLSGCLFAVPVIQGFKDAGLTESDRATLLQESLKRFHHALEDGNRTRLLAYASEDFRDTFKETLRQYSRFERVVGAEVDFVDFVDDGYKAKVESFVKYYKQSYYIVKERLVAQTWEYTYSDGWKLHGYEVLEEEVAQG